MLNNENDSGKPMSMIKLVIGSVQLESLYFVGFDIQDFPSCKEREGISPFGG